jgi:hypothetical protein
MQWIILSEEKKKRNIKTLSFSFSNYFKKYWTKNKNDNFDAIYYLI